METLSVFAYKGGSAYYDIQMGPDGSFQAQLVRYTGPAADQPPSCIVLQPEDEERPRKKSRESALLCDLDLKRRRHS